MNKTINNKTTHNMSKSRIYAVWNSMLQRCNNPKNSDYKYYGDKGIKVCDRWKSFENFIKDMKNPNEKVQIDRINNNGNYCPENCRWATLKEQANNKSSNKLFSFNNETKTLAQQSELLNIDYKLLHNRIYDLKWSFEDAVKTPVINASKFVSDRWKNGKFNNRKYTGHKGEEHSMCKLNEQ